MLKRYCINQILSKKEPVVCIVDILKAGCQWLFWTSAIVIHFFSASVIADILPLEKEKPTTKISGLVKIEQQVPRVLYSWTSENKLKSMIQEFSGDQNGFYTGVWAARTPLSTFLYGPILVRIKLRPNLKSRKVGDEMYFSNSEQEENVIVTHERVADNVPLTLREYSIWHLTPDLVESISFSTELNLKEMEQELMLVKDPHRYHLDLAFRNKGRPLLIFPDAPIFDGHPWNENILQSRFRDIEKHITKRSGRVLYAPDVDMAGNPHFAPGDLEHQLYSLTSDATKLFPVKKTNQCQTFYTW